MPEIRAENSGEVNLYDCYIALYYNTLQYCAMLLLSVLYFTILAQ